MTDMKKEVLRTVRLDTETDQIIRDLAEEDDRAIAYMMRKLIEEALIARGKIKPKKKG